MVSMIFTAVIYIAVLLLVLGCCYSSISGVLAILREFLEEVEAELESEEEKDNEKRKETGSNKPGSTK